MIYRLKSYIRPMYRRLDQPVQEPPAIGTLRMKTIKKFRRVFYESFSSVYMLPRNLINYQKGADYCS